MKFFLVIIEAIVIKIQMEFMLLTCWCGDILFWLPFTIAMEMCLSSFLPLPKGHKIDYRVDDKHIKIDAFDRVLYP